MPATQIVWFKRDLRLEDHAALSAAAARGPVLPLYIIEPELWEQPSHSTRHWQLIHQSLIDLQRALSATGGELCVRIGAVATVLGALHRELGHFDLLAHEEVGEKWTFDRDKTVLKWCRKRGMNFFQFPQFGVFRGQHDRDGWAKRWREFCPLPPTGLPTTCSGNALQAIAIGKTGGQHRSSSCRTSRSLTRRQP